MINNCYSICFACIGIVYVVGFYLSLFGNTLELNQPKVWIDSGNHADARQRDQITIDIETRLVGQNSGSIVSESSVIDAGRCFQLHGREHRCLPSFIIAGTMKSGTGELMKWLNLHPVLVSGKGSTKENEIHFFTRGYDALLTRSEDSDEQHVFVREYLNMFPPFSPLEVLERRTFDKSPDYIRCPAALKRMRTMLPAIKLIILLRNPTLRLLSSFEHNCRHRRYGKLLKSTATTHWRNAGTCDETRLQYLLPIDEDKKTNGTRVTWLSRGTVINTNSIRGSSHLFHENELEVRKYPCSENDLIAYLFAANRRLSEAAKQEISIGFYDEQMDEVLKIFPKSNILVLFQEDMIRLLMQFFNLILPDNVNMIRNTFGALHRVETFLGLEHVDYSQWATTESLNGTKGPPLRSQLSNPIDDLLVLMGLRKKQGAVIRSSQQLLRKLRSSPDTAWVLDELNSFYHQHNLRLEAILKEGFNLSLPSSWKYFVGAT